jgi:hypothetical protein
MAFKAHVVMYLSHHPFWPLCRNQLQNALRLEVLRGPYLTIGPVWRTIGTSDLQVHVLANNSQGCQNDESLHNFGSTQQEFTGYFVAYQ